MGTILWSISSNFIIISFNGNDSIEAFSVGLPLDVLFFTVI